ncbi:hypothetical protein EYF80_059284 [Liparis tanakae]|uniref:Uncharacterized protein n=1 Tax=Liparis tanakae TaxID=230148 RepID=A0A4Z2EP70_9TELE|nr:hypothetical protein EYF80_059284 [Liparis tanakae]
MGGRDWCSSRIDRAAGGFSVVSACQVLNVQAKHDRN